MMGRERQRLKRRKSILQKVDSFQEQDSMSFVIHYSCEGFYDKTDGRTPRVTSIAIRNLASGQTKSFSIHQIAEEYGLSFDDIEQLYDNLEKSMLDRFFAFVRIHQHCNWIHWNMRDENYGFAAIEHRFRVLQGIPIGIVEERKFDLARALGYLYGFDYVGHPRMEMLIAKNKITNRDFLTGKEEAAAFESQDFIKLHQSTLRKVDAIANIFERMSTNTLKTDSSWLKRNGYSLDVIVELMKEHWVMSILASLSIVFAFVINALDFLKLLLSS